MVQTPFVAIQIPFIYHVSFVFHSVTLPKNGPDSAGWNSWYFQIAAHTMVTEVQKLLTISWTICLNSLCCWTSHSSAEQDLVEIETISWIQHNVKTGYPTNFKRGEWSSGVAGSMAANLLLQIISLV